MVILVPATIVAAILLRIALDAHGRMTAQMQRTMEAYKTMETVIYGYDGGPIDCIGVTYMNQLPNDPQQPTAIFTVSEYRWAKISPFAHLKTRMKISQQMVI